LESGPRAGKFPKRSNRELNRPIREPNSPNRDPPENSKFERDGIWEAIWAELHLTLRERMGREASPLAPVLHSQLVKSAEKGDGAGLVLDKIRKRFPWLELIWADGGYNAWRVEPAVAKVPLLRMEILKHSDDMKGFVVLRHCWGVERTFSWFGQNRHLAKGFDKRAETLATFVTLASIQLAPQAACQGAGRELNRLPVCIG
jgi:transposase